MFLDLSMLDGWPLLLIASISLSSLYFVCTHNCNINWILSNRKRIGESVLSLIPSVFVHVVRFYSAKMMMLAKPTSSFCPGEVTESAQNNNNNKTYSKEKPFIEYFRQFVVHVMCSINRQFLVLKTIDD